MSQHGDPIVSLVLKMLRILVVIIFKMSSLTFVEIRFEQFIHDKDLAGGNLSVKYKRNTSILSH